MTNGKSHHLYRHFDKDGQLLYVGTSLNILDRLAQHKVNSGWFATISNMTIESFETKKQALAAEFIAIKIEKPKHNIQSNNVPFKKKEIESDNITKKDILDNIHDKEYRDRLTSLYLAKDISSQIRGIRKNKRWSQKALCERTDMAQARISLLEYGNYSDHSLNVLKRFASAFDMSIMIKFVSFSDMIEDMTKDDDGIPKSFDDDKSL